MGRSPTKISIMTLLREIHKHNFVEYATVPPKFFGGNLWRLRSKFLCDDEYALCLPRSLAGDDTVSASFVVCLLRLGRHQGGTQLRSLVVFKKRLTMRGSMLQQSLPFVILALTSLAANVDQVDGQRAANRIRNIGKARGASRRLATGNNGPSEGAVPFSDDGSAVAADDVSSDEGSHPGKGKGGKGGSKKGGQKSGKKGASSSPAAGGNPFHVNLSIQPAYWAIPIFAAHELGQL